MAGLSANASWKALSWKGHNRGTSGSSWRPLCAAETEMVTSTTRRAPASGGSWLSLVIQDPVGQRCCRWALPVLALLVSWLWRNLDFSLRTEQTWAEPCTLLSERLCWRCCEFAALARPPLADAVASPARMPTLPAACRLGAFGWAKALRWETVRCTQQERGAFVSLCQKRHVCLRGVGQSTRASLNVASKSNFKGNRLQISNCLLVSVLKAPCIPPVAMLSSPWNYFQHVF